MFWSPSFDSLKDTSDLTGKVAIVTGSNTGLGYSILKVLALKGAKVYMAARTEAKAKAAIEKLGKEGVKDGSVVWLKLDLIDFHATKKAAEEFLSKESRLDILVNNAALTTDPGSTEMVDGICAPMRINHFGHFIFTQTLLPLLKQTAKEPGTDVRIINITSEAHRFPPEVRFKSLEDFVLPYKAGFWQSLVRYGHTKLANILFSNELQRRFDEEQIPILVLSVHPGVALTFAEKLPFPWLAEKVLGVFIPSPDAGARPALFAAASPIPREKPEVYKASYLVPPAQFGTTSAQSQDKELATELWITTEEVLVGRV